MNVYVQTNKYTANQIQSFVDASFCTVLPENRPNEYRVLVKNAYQVRLVKERLCNVPGIERIWHLPLEEEQEDE